jgi:hypothetical protein
MEGGVDKICSLDPPHFSIFLPSCSSQCEVFHSSRNKKIPLAGGKKNTKRMHLVNWNIVRALKIHGGLGILDLVLTNLVLGAKILWHLVTGKKEWWKKVLVNKYLEGDRIRCMDSSPSRQPGSPIWKLLKASLCCSKEK